MVIASKTFIFRDGVSVGDTDGSACRFVSNGVTFYGMYADNNRIFYAENVDLSSFLTVRDGMGDWIDDDYKRVKFAADEEDISGDFAVWFAATYFEETVYLTYSESLTQVADAIRAKGGTSAPLEFPSGYVTAIETIPTGGGADWMNFAQSSVPVSLEAKSYSPMVSQALFPFVTTPDEPTINSFSILPISTQ